MKVQKIYSKNAAYQKFEVLKTNRRKRYRYKEFFVEGVRNINEAIRNNWQISSFLYTKERPLSSWAKNVLETVPTDINYQLTADLMGDLSDKEDTSELLAIVKMREDSFSQFKFSDQPLVALLDRPSNRGNLGTIIRSCDGFGIDGLIITGHAVDLYDPEVIVSSMGSFFSVPVIRLTCNNQLLEFIADMKGKYPGFKVVGSTSHSQNSIHHCDLTAPLLLMIGNETDGLNRTFRELCDELVTIPMAESSSASSFNVGCAATVMFYEAIRQRTRFSEDF